MEMDEVNTKKNEKVKDIPPIPIKTYKWEDIRRKKKKGHYPYTHLNKEPYNEEIDTAELKMDTLRPSKSASVLEKSSSGVDIQEVTETKDMNNGKDYLEVSEGIVETADSSNEDNVSQYLDKDEDPPTITEHVETPGPSKEEEKMVVDREESRAKSEEPKRKRKLSIESSYSRISLSKLGVMKKLREAKEKIKLPKFSFSKSESKLDIPKKSKKDKSDGKESKKKITAENYLAPKKSDKPVYIHIPLKPPPGQTDEFSYLEFEDSKRESSSTSQPANTTSNDLKKSTQEDSCDGSEQQQKEGLQFIILTPPSDDETLDANGISPDTPASDSGKKFFNTTKLKDLKTLARECVDEITPDMPIEGIFFEDVVQVEYVDEQNRPIGKTERSNVLEITEANLPTLEKQLSQRNLTKELEKEIASSMDSLHKIARKNTLKKLKEEQKSKSNETLRKSSVKPKKTQEAPELSGPPPDIAKPVVEIKEAPAKITFEKVAKSAVLKAQENLKGKVVEKPPEKKLEKPEVVASEKKETPQAFEEKILTPQVEKAQPIDTMKSPMYDEEDGLKLSETAVQMINEELAKEQLPKTDEEQLRTAAKNNSIKKKVSFKRRSKQEDPHGVYEDVRVTSDNKKVDGKEQQTKELKMMDQSQSMSVDEEKTYLDDKIIKTTSLEEDYHKWSKSTDHEYEPVNPPAETETQQLPSPTEGQTVDTSLKRSSSKQSKKSTTGSIRIPLKGEEDVLRSEDESGDALTVEEMQARIEDKFFNKAESEHPPTNVTPAATLPSTKENVPQESSAKKIQDAFKTQAGKLRTKIKNIKRPNIHMPQRPNLEKFKLQKPNITMPKIPDQMRVNLPTLPKKGGGSSTRKRPVKQYSTESNAGDSKKKLFDFSTYPRFFKKKKKPDDVEDDAFSESATVPRVKKSSKSRQTKETEKKKKSPDVIRIPLHSEESMDKEENDLSSRARYEEENIDMDDAFLRESQQMRTASALHDAESSRSRWNHGSFHGRTLNDIAPDESNPPKDGPLEIEISEVHDLTDVPKITEVTEMERPQTSPEPELEPELEPEQRRSDMRLVSSFGDVREHGVLEKINSDEYFMQMGNYASKEIQEAFKQPTNPLAKMQADDSFDREFDVSDQSIQEVPKRRPIKKPKRKKTPNVSKERLSYEQESEVEDYPEPYIEQPTRPKRRSKHKKHTKDEKPPYQETIFVQNPEFETMRKAASDNTLLSILLSGVDGHFTGGLHRQEYPQLYENEKMQGIEQPHIMVSHPYRKDEVRYNEDNLDENGKEIPEAPSQNEKEIPEAPPRKQRSLKSLVSEHDSIIDEINLAREFLPPQNESEMPSKLFTCFQPEVNKLEHEYIISTPEEPPVRPIRTRSRTRSHSRTTNQPDEELQTPEIQETPCVEEPCVQQVCDYMGYAVIEKNRYREPPLPPPSRKKRCANPETKFFTVPRPLKDEAPVRPLRNYSTLVPKSKRSPHSSEEEKENVDLGQYMEIEDEGEHSRLQSGEIVQKMKDRPLPAPPRPPRKTKESDTPFKDITHKSNADDEEEPVKMKSEEAEASVQTEPLPDDVVCEELVQEKWDKIIIPTTSKFHRPITEFENVETVTHAALVVAPVPEDFQERPIASFSRSTEKIITIHREVDHEEENSDVPESFKNLAQPQTRIIERIIERPVASSPEVEVLKAQKLQVSDLDVDRLTVNELLASRIKVSEIDSDSISVTEINPKSGNLVIGGMELPISFLQQIVEKLRSAETSNEDQSTTQQPQQDSALKEKDSPETGKEAPFEQLPEIVSETMKNGIASEEVSSDLTEDNTNFPIKTDDNQQSLSEDQVPSLESEETDATLTLKGGETIEENLNITSPESRTEDVSESVSELSPTTLKTTIEYLDNLITEENMKLDLENNHKEDNQEKLEESVGYRRGAASVEEYMQEKFEGADAVEEIPPLIPDTSEEERLIEELKTTSSDQKKTPIEEELDAPPKRPPRHSDIQRLQQSQEDIFIPSQIIENSHNIFLEDSTPPPRPPDPEERLYLRSQPPPSFFVLRSPLLEDFVDEDIPMPPRRKRPPRPPSKSSSEEELPATPRTRRHRTPEPSIPLLAGQLTRACASASERAFRRLIKHITVNVLRNADGKQDLHVMILILLILIAGLILLGNGGNPIVHHYHWEYFNPPKDL